MNTETTKPLRAVIYARLSTAQVGKGAGEESDSIANQVRDLTALAKRLGYELVGTFHDDGISGYKGKNRPGFQKLLTAIADNEINVVLARHQDRLERNEAESFEIRVASVKHKVTWAFASGMTVDPSTAEGGLLAKILSAISEFESHVKTVRLLQHYEGLRTRGLLPAPPRTFGYDGFEVIQDQAVLIRQAYRAVADGKTQGSVVRKWNKAKVPQTKGGKGWTYAHVRSILQRPRNAGLVADRSGELIKVTDDETGEERFLLGQWEPIVSVELWQTVNAILDNETRPSSPGFAPRWLGAGHAKCGICGMPMRSNTVSDARAGTRYSILRCSSVEKTKKNRHPSARNADQLDNDGNVTMRGLDSLIRDAVIAAFAFGTPDLFEEAEPNVGTIQIQLNRLTARREEIREDYRSELITRAEYVADLKATEAPIQVLRARLDDALASAASASMLVNLRADLRDAASHRVSYTAMSDLKSELGRRFDSLDIEQRRQLVEQLLDIRVYGGRLATNPHKYVITHKRVLSLNDPENGAWTADALADAA
jgi:DNA invertase Pin-like site-specific DNA recombinase